jgi:hypothetical protein
VSKRTPITKIITMTKHGCVITYGPVADKPVVRSVIRLPVPLLGELKHEARRRALSVDELAVAILRIVSGERLYDAVLGRVGEVVGKHLPRRP